MPHLHLLVDTGQLTGPISDAREWAVAEGYEDVRPRFEQVLRNPGELAFFAHPVASIEPKETRLDLEFILDFGRHYASEGTALADTIRLFRALIADDVPWELPPQWGLWFRCKGPFDDIFISPNNYARKLRAAEVELMTDG